MPNETIQLDRRGPVVWLTLNRPEALNAINLEMVERYEELLPVLAADESVRVLVITGAGRAFCAGADLKQVIDSLDVAPGEQDFLDRLALNVLGPIRDFPKPVIVAINGLAVAGGLETAMCADLVVAADTAMLGDGHANFGVFPGGGGAALLSRIVAPNVAKYLLLTGRSLSAHEMHTYGFVNLVVQPQELAASAQALAEDLAAKSPLVLRRMKEVANASLDKTSSDALRHETLELRRHLRSYDMAEGLSAFAEKRTAKFEGR